MTMTRFIFIYTMLATALLMGCRTDPGSNNTKDGIDDIEDPDISVQQPVPSFQEDRYAWQKPFLVMDKLGDLDDKIVADIGAGTGYFTFRLMQRAKRVIAIDIDQNKIDLIELFRQNLDSIQQLNVETRLALPDDPKLRFEEVDVVVIINTIGYISDVSSYLKNLREKIKPSGKIMIVDFKMKRISQDIAPPSEFRMSLLELEDLLAESGYVNIVADDRSLDYQYIVMANKPG